MHKENPKATSSRDIDEKIREISKKIEKTTPIERAVDYNELLKSQQAQSSRIKAIFRTLFHD